MQGDGRVDSQNSRLRPGARPRGSPVGGWRIAVRWRQSATSHENKVIAKTITPMERSHRNSIFNNPSEKMKDPEKLPTRGPGPGNSRNPPHPQTDGNPPSNPPGGKHPGRQDGFPPGVFQDLRPYPGGTPGGAGLRFFRRCPGIPPALTAASCLEEPQFYRKIPGVEPGVALGDSCNA